MLSSIVFVFTRGIPGGATAPGGTELWQRNDLLAAPARGVIPRSALRGIESSERLGRYRWVGCGPFLGSIATGALLDYLLTRRFFDQYV